MKSLIISSFLTLSLFSISVTAKKLAQPVAQIQERSEYVGGWPLGLAASETTGCPAFASVKCQVPGEPLDCCPNGQTAFATDSLYYCCPDANDCKTAVELFPVCANSTWIMYTVFNTPFCCLPGQQATSEGIYGLCEPADVAIPSIDLAHTASQDTLPATAAASSSSIVTSTTFGTTSTASVTATNTIGSSTAVITATNTTSTAFIGTSSMMSVASGGENSMGEVPSLSPTTSKVGSALTTAPASRSVSASGTTSASASVKTASSKGVSMNSNALNSEFAICFILGIFALIG